VLTLLPRQNNHWLLTFSVLNVASIVKFSSSINPAGISTYFPESPEKFRTFSPSSSAKSESVIPTSFALFPLPEMSVSVPSACDISYSAITFCFGVPLFPVSLLSSAFTEKAGSSVTAIDALIKSARNRLFIVFSFFIYFSKGWNLRLCLLRPVPSPLDYK